MQNWKILIREWLISEATGYIRAEEKELAHVFMLLLFGSLIGIPAPPVGLSLELLPYLGKELKIMENRVVNGDDLFGQMAGLFDI